MTQWFTLYKSQSWFQSPGNSGSTRVLSLSLSSSPPSQSSSWGISSEISPTEAVPLPAEEQGDGEHHDSCEGIEILKIQLKITRGQLLQQLTVSEGHLVIQNDRYIKFRGQRCQSYKTVWSREFHQRVHSTSIFQALYSLEYCADKKKNHPGSLFLERTTVSSLTHWECFSCADKLSWTLTQGGR